MAAITGAAEQMATVTSIAAISRLLSGSPGQTQISRTGPASVDREIMTGVAAMYCFGLLIASVPGALGPRSTYTATALTGYIVTFAVIGVGSVILIRHEGGPAWRRLPPVDPSAR